MRLREDMPHLDGATEWLNHDMIEKKDLIGKPTLFHFWSISCDACKSELSSINQLRDTHDEKINVIAVHMPRSNDDLSIEEVEKNAKTYDISQPIYVDSDHILTDIFSVHYVPAYFLFDAEGKLRHFQGGDSNIKMLFKRIDRMIRLNN